MAKKIEQNGGAKAAPEKPARAPRKAKPKTLEASGTTRASAGSGSDQGSRPSRPEEPGKLKIKLVKSPIGYSARQRAVVAGLGLRRMHQIVERQDTRAIRGMVAKVAHLVAIVS